eukprot:scaffold29081_cov94-Isochrysis_galbana.AAC.3
MGAAPGPHGSASSDALSEAMRSSAFSIPHESRMKPSVIPTLSLSSGSMLACVMTAGQVQMDSSAPKFSQSDQGRWIESMSARPEAVPPVTSNHSMPPWSPFMCCRSASSFWGKEASPG